VRKGVREKNMLKYGKDTEKQDQVLLERDTKEKQKERTSKKKHKNMTYSS
jgi:hypothetical protein